MQLPAASSRHAPRRALQVLQAKEAELRAEQEMLASANWNLERERAQLQAVEVRRRRVLRLS